VAFTPGGEPEEMTEGFQAHIGSLVPRGPHEKPLEPFGLQA
jgi:hypothetical protein